MTSVSDAKAIYLRAPTGEIFYFALDASQPAAPYFVKNVEGLDPPDVTLNMNDSQFGGRLFNGARAQGRRFVFTVGFNLAAAPGETIATLKQRLYKLNGTSAMAPVSIQLITGYTYAPPSSIVSYPDNWKRYNYKSTIASITGYTAKVVANSFSKDPEVIITIDCESPYFRDFYATRTTFPSMNFDCTNLGDVKSGIYIEITVKTSISSLSITAGNTYPYQNMSIATPFEPGQKIYLDTNPGSRSIYRTYPGYSIRESLLAYMDNPDWFMIAPGVTSFKTDVDESALGPVAVEFIQRYLGV